MPTVCLLYPRHHLRQALRTYLSFLPSRKRPRIHLQQRVLVSRAHPALRPVRIFLTALSYQKKAEERGVSTVSYLLTIGLLKMIFIWHSCRTARFPREYVNDAYIWKHSNLSRDTSHLQPYVLTRFWSPAGPYFVNFRFIDATTPILKRS